MSDEEVDSGFRGLFTKLAGQVGHYNHSGHKQILCSVLTLIYLLPIPNIPTTYT